MYQSKVLLCLLFVCFIHEASAQVQIIYPMNGMTNVERSPQITLRTQRPIDPRSLSTTFPDQDAMGIHRDRPTVLVIREQYVGLPVAERTAKAVSGTLQLLDPFTVQFQPNKLMPGLAYHVSVEGLVTADAPPTMLPPVEFRFQVAPDAPHITWCSLDEVQQLRCNQSIALRLSEQWTYGEPLLRSAIRLMERGKDSDHPLDVPYTVKVNGTLVEIIPDQAFQLGSTVDLFAQLGSITGETLHNKQFHTVVRQATTLQVSAVSEDGGVVPDSIRFLFERRSGTALLGRTVNLFSPTSLPDRWRFIRWQSPLLNLPTGNSIDVTPDCMTTNEAVPIQAVLRRIDTVRLIVKAGTGGSIHVYDSNYEPVRVITGTDTIPITKDDSLGFLVAVPDSGKGLRRWVGNGVKDANTTAPVVSLVAATDLDLFGDDLATVDVSYATEYVDLDNQEAVYGFFATIMDADPQVGWDVRNAVEFVTENKYVGTVPYEQTICLRATDCWEIIGYFDTDNGNFELYDGGQKRACVTAYMSNPFRQICFLVQRKDVQLVVEKVLLATDDPDDIVSNPRFAVNAIVKVELRKEINNKVQWIPLTELNCNDGNVKFSPYMLKCGDEVRLTAYSSHERGQYWTRWDDRIGYARPTAESDKPGNILYRMVLNEEYATFASVGCNNKEMEWSAIRVRACYRQQFGIEAIGFSLRTVSSKDRSTAEFREVWLDPLTYRDLNADEPRGGRHIEYVPKHGTLAKIRFSMPVDQLSILQSGITIVSYNNVLYSDHKASNLDFEVLTSDGNVSFETIPGESPRTAVISIMDPNSKPILQALHGGTFELHLRPVVRSLRGHNLEYHVRFMMQSIELPAYALRLHEIDFEFDGDVDYLLENSGEIYHATMGGDVGPDGVHYADLGFRRIPDCSEQQGEPPGECTLEHSDKDGAMSYGNLLLWLQPNWMGSDDLAWWYASSYDEDCKDKNDCFVNRVQDMLNLVKTKAKDYQGGDVTDGEKLIGHLIEVGVSFVNALLPADEQDRHLGYGNFISSGASMWGFRRHTRYVEVGDENTTYRLNPALLVNRGVIR